MSHIFTSFRLFKVLYLLRILQAMVVNKSFINFFPYSGENLQFVFTNIDPKDHERVFYFTIKVVGKEYHGKCFKGLMQLHSFELAYPLPPPTDCNLCIGLFSHVAIFCVLNCSV